MRLFVALVPPAEVVAALPPVPEGVRAVPREQVHLTLAFLGELPSAEPVGALLPAALVGPAPRLQLAGAGRFGTAVWLGLRGDIDRLAELARRVQQVALDGGVALELRRWQPHLTVGRVRDRRPWAIDSLAGYTGPTAAWTEVRLVRSTLGPGGARHETLTSWHLPPD
jgi:2'-5' RNA ligase